MLMTKYLDITILNQLLFCTSFCGCLGNLKIAFSFVKIWVRSSAWDFFPLYFFCLFYQFSIRSQITSSHTKFQLHNFFFKRNSMFSVLEKTVSAQIRSILNICGVTQLQKFLNGFQNYKTLNFSFKKNFMMLKFCMGARDLTADRKLIK